MKRFLATILAFVYLSTSIGATVHLHYCMGKLMSWGLVDHDGNNCATCGMAKKTDNANTVSAEMGCCKDEHKQIQTEKDQKLAQSEYETLSIFSNAVEVNKHTLPDFSLYSIALAFPNINAPPSIGKALIFLLNRNFRI